jgi:hypothetical protein
MPVIAARSSADAGDDAVGVAGGADEVLEVVSLGGS